MNNQITTNRRTASNPFQKWDEISELSLLFKPLMDQHALACDFSQLGNGGPCLVDATQNPTNAYKLRGALACIHSAAQRGVGEVWTASAGNHGAGVALAANILGVTATVFVPTTAPRVKVEKIAGFGAKVVQVGENFDDCLAQARMAMAVPNATASFIHPFDDTIVAAGQGTIGLEILEYLSASTVLRSDTSITVYLPIGGGGLIAGVASTIKTMWPRHVLPPKIIGVVDEGVPASALGILFGRPISSVPLTIADGTRVARVGETFLEVAPLIDHIMLVPHDAIVATMRHYYTEHNRVVEASGALALTGEFLARKYNLFNSEKTLNFALLSGSNVDPNTFNDVVFQLERHRPVGHRRIAFDVRIPEQDGELLNFLRVVREFNITSLTYKQEQNTAIGTLRAEFELCTVDEVRARTAILAAFPGSIELAPGAQYVVPVSSPIAQHYRDRLITLKDSPGSFLQYVEKLAAQQELGSVGFLYYRMPTGVNCAPQVVIGVSGSK